MKYPSVLAINLIIHIGFCIVFAIANDVGLALYKKLYGDFSSRGFAAGGITTFAIGVFVIANLTLSFVTKNKLKPLIVLTAIVSIALLVLPAHPLRAIFYITLTGVLSTIAIVASAVVVRTMEKRGRV
ncbi:hypothetical protein [Pseudomonas sp. GD03944]|uniref:hypothetical protein n=1 Tax=Pseudomonas sp. GD03944 TaxID=2975409 RepID=UPI00244AD357|nr:hypothetical protein [Pseudomonas sp. GD03944]MDH1263869.1 hypothetical protein [Pseudomonas sp. GD03944]